MNKILIIIFLLVVVGSIYLYTQLSDNTEDIFAKKETDTGSPDEDSSQDFQNQEQAQNSVDDNFDNTLAKSDNSGEGSSQSSCSLQRISYSLKKFEKSSECSNYEESSCVDKTITCSLEVTNLDYAISGLFEIEFRFFEAESEVFGTDTDAKNLAPRESKIFQGSLSVQGQDADKNITCSFNAAQAPEKEVCGVVQSPAEDE